MKGKENMMNRIEEYYDKTESEKPRKNMEYFINEIKCNPGNATELGCGAGNDTIFLIKNNWNVLAIDRENVETRIARRLKKEDVQRFSFQKQNFEKIDLKETNLIVANFSLPFCERENFKNLWNKIERSILPNRIFYRKLFWRE